MVALSLISNIYIRFLLPISVAITGIGILSILPLSLLSKDISDQVSVEMITNNVVMANIRINNAKNYIGEQFAQVENDINMLHNYASSIFEQKFPVDNYYKSYNTYNIAPPVDFIGDSFASTV
jgi:hypothetical protein